MSIVLDGTAGITTPEIVSTGGPLVVNASAPDNSVVVDASGNVGIGTSSPVAKNHIRGSGTSGQVTASWMLENFSSGTAGMDITGAAGASRWRYLYGGGPGTGTNTLTEAMCILTEGASAGSLLVGATATVASERLNVTRGGSSLRVIHVENTRNVIGDEVYRSLLGSNCNNTASTHFVATIAGVGDRLYIFGSGNVVNSNNSYGALSDVKLKENIVDASPKLDKLNQVRVVNYNLKTDPDQKLLGVVAQELEQIFPGMIDETPDKDAEGNELGTTTKAVKYSVFVPMLIKGLQELKAINDAQAQTIESLTARVVALENQIV